VEAIDKLKGEPTAPISTVEVEALLPKVAVSAVIWGKLEEGVQLLSVPQSVLVVPVQVKAVAPVWEAQRKKKAAVKNIFRAMSASKAGSILNAPGFPKAQKTKIYITV